MTPIPTPGGRKARMTKTMRTSSASTPKKVARPEQTPPTMRSDPRRRAPPVVSPMARQLSHFVHRPKNEGAPGAPSPNLELLDGPPADQQVVDDADDRQDQQQVDETPGHVEREAQQPQHEEDDDHGPDQTHHQEPPRNDIVLFDSIDIILQQGGVGVNQDGRGPDPGRAPALSSPARRDDHNRALAETAGDFESAAAVSDRA